MLSLFKKETFQQEEFQQEIIDQQEERRHSQVFCFTPTCPQANKYKLPTVVTRLGEADVRVPEYHI